jgi:hypothetical protein
MDIQTNKCMPEKRVFCKEAYRASKMLSTPEMANSAIKVEKAAFMNVGTPVC